MSNLFGRKGPARPHLVQAGGGLSGELADLRSDINEAFSELEAGGRYVTEEWTDVAIADVDGIVEAIDSSSSIVSLSGDDLDGEVGGDEMIPPRNITITTSSHAHINAVAVVITGLVRNRYGILIAQTDTITLTDNGGVTDAGTKAFSMVTAIVIPAQGGASGSLSIGFGNTFGFAYPIRSRESVASVLREVVGGVAYTPGEKTVHSWNKAAADSDPGDATAETAVGYVQRRSRLVSAVFEPASSLTGHDTNNAVLTVKKYDSAGANGATIASMTTNTTSGNWTAWAGKALTLAAAANLEVAAGSSLTFAITKANDGVTVPAGRLVLTFEAPMGTIALPSSKAPHGTYTPSQVPDDSLDYSITYEVAAS